MTAHGHGAHCDMGCMKSIRPQIVYFPEIFSFLKGQITAQSTCQIVISNNLFKINASERGELETLFLWSMF
mgnify:CR=1 FL=1